MEWGGGGRGILLNVQGVGSFVVHCNCNLIVPILFVFDLIVNLFRIALWPSIEKKISPGFSLVLFILVLS